MSNDIPFCVNCKWCTVFLEWCDGIFCTRPDLIDPVTGEHKRRFCSEERASATSTCGPEGKRFDMREEDGSDAVD